MGLNYKGKDHKEAGDSLWASYSDLFMGLSFIFLLLYVTSSLRTGTTQFEAGAKVRSLAQQNEELKNQIRIYESLNKDYLDNEATASEQQQYEELMSQLDLLQDEANKEKQELEKAANEHAVKERSLNKYQAMVKSIINTNMASKSKIKKRDDVIGEQDVEIENQTDRISSLESEMKAQERELQKGQDQIAKAEKELQNRLRQVQNARKAQKITQAKMRQQIAQINAEAKQKIDSLTGETQAVQRNLASLSNQLTEVQKQAQAKAAEAESLKGVLEVKKGELAGKQQELAGKQQELLGKQQELAGKEKELAEARAEADARKNIAAQIKQGFAQAGVKADVNPNTGDVTIDFGDHFFDSGSANLKPEMTKILERALPIYAKSLMNNKAISDKITSLEIVGYASPTYGGKYVDPRSSSPADKKAIDYNLDLSYQRAKSIFEHVFDQDKMSFTHQGQLRPLVKVAGKSFFESAKQTRGVASGMSAREFCKQHDCKKAQKVLIKFNVDQK